MKRDVSNAFVTSRESVGQNTHLGNEITSPSSLK